jgi:hypothetical protein
MRISWLDPTLEASVKDRLRHGHDSWEELFDAAGTVDAAGEPPRGISARSWPRVAAHVARAERVREVVAARGRHAAAARFADSPHAVERAALLASELEDVGGSDVVAVRGILTCAVDEWVIYGQFLSRLVEAGLGGDPAGTVDIFERFVAAAAAIETDEESWPERLRVARDGLATLYVRVDRKTDAERIYGERFAEEPTDATIAISAARAFLEAGDTARSISWLERGALRASEIGRGDLVLRLQAKVTALRGRMN